jgi:hypothetical protein
MVDGKGMWFAVDYEFVTTGCSVDLVLADDLPLLREALGDCISTHPPQGAAQDCPSTYWIDRALRYLESRLDDGGKEPLASGSATYLQVRDGIVEARYEFGIEDDDRFDAVPAEDLLALLKAWRTKVLEESADRRAVPLRMARPMPPL